MNEVTSVPKTVVMTKCTNKEHTHFHPNGTVGAACERRIDSKEGILHCQGTLILTKGQQFREKHGITPSFKRNMQRKGLDPKDPASIDAYRQLRKPLRHERAKVKKAKHDSARAGRKERKSSSTTKTGKS